jgi:large subunit ribosomal protein L9
MLVTLLENVKALGSEGQSVEVPEGYALNFLFPQHLAVKEEKTKDELAPQPRKLSKAEQEEEKLAAEIDGIEVVVPVKAVKGKLKSPVTATEIRAGLKELGYSVEKKMIKTDLLNAFGSVEVPVEFPSGFESLIRVTIEPA